MKFHENIIISLVEIKQIVQLLKKQIKQIFSKLNHISLTADLWKNKAKKYFLGLTAHFSDGELNYRNHLVGFRSFSKNHKAVNIKSFIEIELQEDALDTN